MKNWMWTSHIAAAMLAALGTSAGCGSGTRGKDVPRVARAFLGATATDIDRVLGMEAPTTDWSIPYSAAGTIGSSTTATQGVSSLALSPRGWVPIKSIPLSSLGSQVGTAVQIDLQYQGAQPNPYWFGTITLGVDIPSKTVDSTQSGLIVNALDLTGKLTSSGWSTLSFAIPTALQTALAGTYTDLTFTITLNVPTDFAGTYLIDNLRFQGQSGTATGTSTSTTTGSGTGTATATGTNTSTSTVTGTATNTSGVDGGSPTDGGSATACLQNWRGSGTCGQWCTRETQSDRAACQVFLDCYQSHGCGPSTCGGQDDVCGVNHPGTNSWGMAPKTIADQVYQCLACPGSSPVTSCNALPDTTPCTDGNACTQKDTCHAGTCVPGPAVVCHASDQCHDVGTCDTKSGKCGNPAKLDETSCDDGNACTNNDVCAAGVCGGTLYTCDDGVACTDKVPADGVNPQPRR